MVFVQRFSAVNKNLSLLYIMLGTYVVSMQKNRWTYKNLRLSRALAMSVNVLCG